MSLLLTVQAAADEYGYPVSTIYRLVETGSLPVVREKARGRIRILRTDMDAWIVAHRTPTAPPVKVTKRVLADSLPGADRYVS